MSATLEKPAAAPVLTPGLRPAGAAGPSIALRSWHLGVCVVLLVAAFVVFCMSIRIGDYPLTFGQVVSTLIGRGDATTSFIIMELRMPRALVGVIAGVALAVAGAVVQNVARNPLASPDVLGITGGAGVAAVFLVTMPGGAAAGILNTVGLPAAALTGGLVTGILVYALAWRRGLDGMRLVLIGVAITALAQALVTWMLVRADIRDVGRAQAWLVGSLDLRSWSQVWSGLIITSVCVAITFAAAFALRPLQFGDDVAAGLGVRVNAVRVVVLILAALLTGAAVAMVGPVAFVAFVSPQVAMRLTRSPVPPLFASAVTGALLLTGADLIARTALPVTLPVGIVTAVIGGPFLIFLVVRANLRTSA